MTASRLLETFRGPGLDPRLHWLSEPPRWELDPAGGGLRLWPAGRTDFWQRTHYGFEADNGHALLMEAQGDFVLTTRVTAHPRHRYDQAGLLLRLSPACWIKTSVEFEPEGPNRLGAVVTNAQASDWSTQPLDPEIGTVGFRLRREGRDVIAECCLEGEPWQQLRMARLQELSATGPVLAGLYACSPTAAGFMAAFDRLALEPSQALD
jgi:regulation of enolase protein 1 (concanavalin A-like superfamily)